MMFTKMLSRGKTDLNIFSMLTMLIILMFSLPAIASAKPVIFYTDILSGPNTGGENDNGAYLSIFGKGFGKASDLGSSTKVYINGTEVAAYKYLGSSYGRPDVQQLSIQPGPNVTTGSIKVVVNGDASNVDHSFTVRSGKIFFVALNGSDTGGEIGNISKPFRNIDNTFHRSDFNPGDFLVVRGGFWSDRADSKVMVRTGRSGTATHPLTIYGYPGEKATLSTLDACGVGYDCYAFRSRNLEPSPRRYLNIANFHLFHGTNTTQLGHSAGEHASAGPLGVGGDSGIQEYIRIVNIDIEGGGGGSVTSCQAYVWGANHVKFLGVSHRDTALREFTDLDNWHMLYLDSSPSLYIEMGWGVFANQGRGGTALQIIGRSTLPIGNLKIHDNIFANLPTAAISMGANIGDVEIYNNIFFNTGYEDENNPTHPIDHGDYSGIRIGGDSGSRNVKINNNTFYHNWDGILHTSTTGRANSLEFKNNIIYAYAGNSNYYDGALANTIISGNNLWYSEDGLTPPSWDDASISINGKNPQFAHVWVPSPQTTDEGLDHSWKTMDFHILSSSPAIDMGVEVKITGDEFTGSFSLTYDHDRNSLPMDGDYSGSAEYDIGAYEYTGTYIPPDQDSVAPAPPTGLILAIK